MNLRPYQRAAVDSVFDTFKAASSALIVMPTGTGKTVVFSTIAHEFSAGRVLVLAHREELINQAAHKLADVTGEKPGIEMGEFHCDESGSLYGGGCRVIVSSVQTMCRDSRLAKFRPELFGLVVIDEAHHSPASTYRKVIDHYRQNQNCKVLGVTATPNRADEEALGQVFEAVAFEYRIPDAINDAWLVPITQQYIEVEALDLSGVRTTAGDLNASDLERVLNEEKAMHGMVHPAIELAGDRQTIFFSPTVSHAERVAEIFNRHRAGSAFCLHGKTPDEARRDTLQRYSRREFQYLVNCGLFLEGFDEPWVGCVAVGRPTKSEALYSQMIGRGTRVLPGVVDAAGYAFEAEDRQERIACSAKPDCLVLDFVGNSGRHKLVSTADILGGKYSDAVVDKARENAGKKVQDGQAVDMQKELEFAEKELAEEEAARKRKALVAKAKYHVQTISPFDLFDVRSGREPGWFKGKLPTARQIEVLSNAGVDTRDVSYWQASQLIDNIKKRRENGLCSYKQAKLLGKYGIDPEGVTFERASELIDQIAKNGWKPLKIAG